MDQAGRIERLRTMRRALTSAELYRLRERMLRAYIQQIGPEEMKKYKRQRRKALIQTIREYVEAKLPEDIRPQAARDLVTTMCQELTIAQKNYVVRDSYIDPAATRGPATGDPGHRRSARGQGRTDAD